MKRRTMWFIFVAADIVFALVSVAPEALAFNLQSKAEYAKFVYSPAVDSLEPELSNSSGSSNSKSNVSSTPKSSFFGYDFTLQRNKNGTIRMIIGSPKMLDPANISLQNAPWSPGQKSRGSIQSCEMGTTLSLNQDESCSPANPPKPKEGDNFGLAVSFQPDGESFACSPTRELDCGTVRNNPGYCFKSEDFGSTWNATDVTDDTACPNQTMVDVLFVLDGSNSVGKTNFLTVKSWIKTISKELGIDHGIISVGVVQYSMSWRVRTHIKIGSSSSYKEFAAEVDKIELDGWKTFTGAALERVLEDFQNTDNYNKTRTKQVMILLTDGKANDPAAVQQNAEALRDIGVIPYTVGVGDVNETELRLIANGDPTNDTRVYQVGGFDGLDAIAKELNAEIAGLVLEGGTQQNTTSYKMNFAEMGLALARSEPNGNGRLYLGAVGAYDWSGTVTKYDRVDDTTPDVPTYEEVQKVLPGRTKESYMGYSVTTGYFDGGNTEYVATGAPRYMLMGAVVIYEPRTNNNKFNNHLRLMGQPTKRKLGAYFGGSVLATDVNGDGKDDLFVGAPLYVDQSYDEGRVFVYVSVTKMSEWARDSYRPLELVGDNLAGGRFGTAMASAGDLNRDGFNDVIVGAPLVGGDRGAVFVYHGNSKGVATTSKQRILASEMTGVTLKYFGQALQGGVDLDGNQYPDIAVGAPKSDTVVIFRSRPVVNIQSEIKFLTGNIDIIECIDQGYKNCTEIQVCFKTSGVSVESSIDFRFNVTMDSQKTDTGEKRLEFLDTNQGASPASTWSEEITLALNVNSCLKKKVHMKTTVQDYDADIEAEVEYDLLESHTTKPLSSVRDPYIPNKKSATLKFIKSCGGDGCYYDLRVKANMNLPQYNAITGKDLTNGTALVVDQSTETTPVTVRVNLSNHGENAFDTKITIKYTSLLSLSTFATRASFPPTNSCVVEPSDQQVSTGGSLTLHYNYKTSIMRQNSWCYFEFNLMTANLRNNGSLEEFFVKVQAEASDSSQSSTEIKPLDNTWSETRKILYRSDISLKKAGDSLISFNYTEKESNITSVTEIGGQTPDIVADISVNGLGHSKIPSLDAKLRYPSRTASGEALLYLYKVECIPTDGNTRASCSCNESIVNTLNLTLDAPNGNNTNGSYHAINPPQYITQESTFDCYADGADDSSCETLQCTITDLSESSEISVKAYFRLWTSNIKFNETLLKEIELRSRFQVDSNNSPYIVDGTGKNQISHSEQLIATAKKFETPSPPVEVKDLLWIYIVATGGGLFLLLVLTFVLWKVGFFNSKYADMKKDAEGELANETEMPTPGGDSQAGVVN